MCKHLTEAEVEDLRRLVDAVTDAPTKAAVKEPLRRLKSKEAQVRLNLAPCLALKFGEVVSYAETASGRVREKQHWQQALAASWYVFENGARSARS